MESGFLGLRRQMLFAHLFDYGHGRPSRLRRWRSPDVSIRRVNLKKSSLAIFMSSNGCHRHPTQSVIVNSRMKLIDLDYEHQDSKLDATKVSSNHSAASGDTPSYHFAISNHTPLNIPYIYMSNGRAVEEAFTDHIPSSWSPLA